jgi:hypothetical protein
MRWAEHIVCMCERRGAYRVLVGKREGKRALGRARCGWGDCIKMDLHEVGWGAWTGLIWLRTGTVVGFCECGNELLGFIKYREFVD